MDAQGHFWPGQGGSGDSYSRSHLQTLSPLFSHFGLLRPEVTEHSPSLTRSKQMRPLGVSEACQLSIPQLPLRPQQYGMALTHQETRLPLPTPPFLTLNSML